MAPVLPAISKAETDGQCSLGGKRIVTSKEPAIDSGPLRRGFRRFFIDLPRVAATIAVTKKRRAAHFEVYVVPLRGHILRFYRGWPAWPVAASALLWPALALASQADPPMVLGIPVDFVLFALTLAGIALFHHYTLPIALVGLAVISVFKIVLSPFAEGSGVSGWLSHLANEWVLLANLLGLLLGFALVSK